MFGYPCRRSRHYRITWDPQRLAWSLAAWPSTLVHASQKIGFLTCLLIWRLCVWLRTGSSKNWSRWFCFHPQLCQLYRPALFLSVIPRKTLSSVKRIWPGLTVSLMIVRSQHYWCWKVNYALPFFLDFECDVAGIRRLTWHATGPNLKDQSSSRCPRTRSRGRGWRTKTQKNGSLASRQPNRFRHGLPQYEKHEGNLKLILSCEVRGKAEDGHCPREPPHTWFSVCAFVCCCESGQGPGHFGNSIKEACF